VPRPRLIVVTWPEVVGATFCIPLTTAPEGIKVFVPVASSTNQDTFVIDAEPRYLDQSML
jgi:hypothetical protein